MTTNGGSTSPNVASDSIPITPTDRTSSPARISRSVRRKNPYNSHHSDNENGSESESDSAKFGMTHGLTPLTPGASAERVLRTIEEGLEEEFNRDDDEDEEREKQVTTLPAKRVLVKGPVAIEPTLKGSGGGGDTAISLNNFELLRILGKGSFGKVSCLFIFFAFC